MKKIFISVVLISIVSLSAAANNIENIYGKIDVNLNNSFKLLYGNNFGSMLKYDNLDPGYVDIAYAENKILSLVAENEVFAQDVEKYKSDIIIKRSQVSEMNDLIDKIDLLFIDLKSTSAQLYNVKTNLTDRELRQKAQVSIEENRQQIYDLKNKKYNTENSLIELREKIEVSEKFVTVNNIYIRRNNSEITFLKECIQYSKTDTTGLNTVIDKSTSFQEDVNDILNVSF